jgi:hypothetical protein
MRILAALFVVALAGCSINPLKERERLFAPERLNAPTSRDAFVDSYAQALVNAQASPTRTNVAAYVDAGNALNARNCSEWLNRVTMARRGLLASDHNLAVAGGLVTTLAGIFSWPARTVALLGAGQVAVQGLGENLQTDALAAPSPYQTQSTLLGMLNACSDQLTADAPGLKFSQAYARLETCARACTHEAAQATASNALAQTVTTVNPTSGALTTTAVSSSFQKDDSGARIIAYWMRGSVVDKTADANLKAWMREHGIESSVPFLAHSKLYEAARKQAVQDLGIPEAK